MNIVTKNEFYDSETSNNRPETSVRFARIVSTTDNKAFIRFFGDSSDSRKLYPVLDSYTPQTGQTVMLINDIIIGGLRP